MPNIIRKKKSETLRLPCDDPSDSFVVQYTNRGEPFREGIEIGIENQDFEKELIVMLQNSEAVQLRDFLNKYYPV
ncbi:MAG: hypothetical protein C9356_11745 [Oleiphilus sp.]|nr:MAG: hypothetical protein C9356_11745 [Oleiphilus sp.]